MIRLAAPEDIPAIASVLFDAFVEYRQLYTEEGFSVTTPSEEQLLNRWKEGPVWVGLSGNQIVGTIAAVPKATDLYVRSMAILPSSRGRGLGLQLLREVEAYAITHSFQRMVLNTTPFLDLAIRLYERFGFQRISNGQNDLHGTPLFSMQKDLFSTQSR